MKLFLLAVFLPLIFAQFDEQVTVVTSSTGTVVRALEVLSFPPRNPRLVEVTGLALTKNNITKTLDAVQFLLNTLGEATIQFNYFTETVAVKHGSTGGPQNTTDVNFALAFRAFFVFEFDNNDGVPGFQETTGPNKDVVTGTYDLSSFALSWNVALTQSVVSGVNVTTITATTADNVFSLKLVFAGNAVKVGNTAITPDQVKISFTIQWFNNSLNQPSLFSTGPSNAALHPNAEVALATLTAADNGVFTNNNGTNGFSLQFNTSTYSASFKYANNVTVIQNGVEVVADVRVHLADNSNAFYVGRDWVQDWVFKIGFFSFDTPRPSLVFWDPVVGSDTPDTIGAGSSGAGVSLSPLAILLMLAIAVFFL